MNNPAAALRCYLGIKAAVISPDGAGLSKKHLRAEKDELTWSLWLYADNKSASDSNMPPSPGTEPLTPQSHHRSVIAHYHNINLHFYADDTQRKITYFLSP